ncbi:hypothetical protein PTTG_26275 [Puccinia triticina 1-1 BBBD Race 1]|uniref:Uncharacterized protein n=1 Tax=Puccinia triticina (isolate 1-1 / race 1 (BBBD)) TaxID=630390 RepID=A0A180GUW1_PUCT1|nr:hypothetical protein PTTG_26275 [Puccinia triticina 1-1 BBBD Race 1]
MEDRLFSHEETTALSNFLEGRFFPLEGHLAEPFHEKYVTRQPKLKNLEKQHGLEVKLNIRTPKPLSKELVSALNDALEELPTHQQSPQTSVQMAYYGRVFFQIAPDQHLFSDLIRSHIIKAMKSKIQGAGDQYKKLYSALIATEEWSKSIEHPSKQERMAKQIYDSDKILSFFQDVTFHLENEILILIIVFVYLDFAKIHETVDLTGDSTVFLYRDRYFYGEKPLVDLADIRLKHKKKGQMSEKMSQQLDNALEIFLEIKNTDKESALKIAYYVRKFFDISKNHQNSGLDQHIKERIQSKYVRGSPRNNPKNLMLDALNRAWSGERYTPN